MWLNLFSVLQWMGVARHHLVRYTRPLSLVLSFSRSLVLPLSLAMYLFLSRRSVLSPSAISVVSRIAVERTLRHEIASFAVPMEPVLSSADHGTMTRRISDVVALPALYTRADQAARYQSTLLQRHEDNIQGQHADANSQEYHAEENRRQHCRRRPTCLVRPCGTPRVHHHPNFHQPRAHKHGTRRLPHAHNAAAGISDLGCLEKEGNSHAHSQQPMHHLVQRLGLFVHKHQERHDADPQ